jgi:hypothetical protein
VCVRVWTCVRARVRVCADGCTDAAVAREAVQVENHLRDPLKVRLRERTVLWFRRLKIVAAQKPDPDRARDKLKEESNCCLFVSSPRITC